MDLVFSNNLERLTFVAQKLGTLRDDLVFLGGVTTELLITDTAAPPARPTLDVDTIVEVSTITQYYELEKSLRALGFTQPVGSEHPICRWQVGGVLLDVMPTNEEILGFSNTWYSEAISNSGQIQLPTELEIRIITAPYFLATKIEAFYGRGEEDFLLSHDMEDMISLIDGREELINDVRNSSPSLRKFLANQFDQLLKNERFTESLSGHMLSASGSQSRVPLLISRMEALIAQGSKEEE